MWIRFPTCNLGNSLYARVAGLALVLGGVGCGAGGPEIRWARMLDFVALSDVVARPDGGVVAVGHTTSTETFDRAPFGQGTYRPYAIWLSAQGDVQWESVGYYSAYGQVAVDGRGQIYATGRIGETVPIAGTSVRALDRYGMALWEFEREQPDTYRHLVGDPRGGVFVASDGVVMSLADGYVRWSVDVSDLSRVYALAATDDGDARLLVAIDDWDEGRLLFEWTIAADGRVVETEVNVPGASEARGIAMGPGGTLVASVAADRQSVSSAWTMYVFDDSTDGPEYSVDFPEPGQDTIVWSEIVAERSGQVLMAGHERPSDEETPVSAVLRAYDGSDEPEWERRFQFSDHADARGIGCPASDTGPYELRGTRADQVIAGVEPGRWFGIGRQHCRHAWIVAMEEP